ncbi:MAG TPA: alpha/beta fold hydrolase [Xanthobacteraceae bacterium]|nr:alpha/beta fold hydrolase [Xanthobacteraceae bacterium]
MYEPTRYSPLGLAFLWQALAAASASEIAALAAKQLVSLAVGEEKSSRSEPQWFTPHRVALRLKTVHLREFTLDPQAQPVLLCAPFALHGAAICDLEKNHSLVAALRAAGLNRLFVTDWRSATPDMQSLGIDDYLADLNVLIDDIGAPVDLIGLCQGGWMALLYAARFPKKVRKLVLAAAPIDTKAAASALSTLAETSSLAVFHELVRLGDGLVPGGKVLKFWGPETIEQKDIRDILETDEHLGSAAFTDLEAAFRDWHAWTLDLPGVFFLETVEKLYHDNAIAAGTFEALGRRVDLAAVTAPLFLLSAHDDELVAPAQLLAVEHLVGTAPSSIDKAIIPGSHVGIFVGKAALQCVWPGIAHWLTGTRQRATAAAE